MNKPLKIKRKMTADLLIKKQLRLSDRVLIYPPLLPVWRVIRGGKTWGGTPTRQNSMPASQRPSGIFGLPEGSR